MIPQEIKNMKEVYEESTLKELGSNPNGTRMDIIYRAMHEYGSIVSAEKDKFINDLKVENMTHEYNQAEAERFRPEYERQLLEGKESRIKELEDALTEMVYQYRISIDEYEKQLNSGITFEKLLSFGLNSYRKSIKILNKQP